jgi:hypothetical protein
MSEYPLLIFPRPEPADKKPSTGFRPSKIHLPDPERQGHRLSPKFSQLQAAFDERRMEIHKTTAGIQPEQVLVIETIGSVDNFIKAVKNVEGFEWMGELEQYDIAPDSDFYDEENEQKKLSGRLFLLMTNQSALEQLILLWKLYQNNPNSKFKRGFAPFLQIFTHLKDIRFWNEQDRLIETGIIDIWKENLQSYIDSNELIEFEVELWFRNDNKNRISSENEVIKLIEQEGGHLITKSVIEEIAYHSLLAELPPQAISKIIENPSTALVKCDNIIFFRPAGQVLVGDKSQEGEIESHPVADEHKPLPVGYPVIAILDGMPLANHIRLAGRLELDDPDEWASDYQYADCIHGTLIASLIIHGDLNSQNYPLNRPIYIRPILKPINWHTSPRPEGIPPHYLTVDLIHRAIKRIFEGDGTEKPLFPTIKIINLSVADKSRPFINEISPWARLIDWLSYKYNVLFINSAGNNQKPISLNISLDEFKLFNSDKCEEEVIKALYKDRMQRKLLSPAETINGLTIGAIHSDNSNLPTLFNRIDPVSQMMPSPISTFGPGYRRSIKPDMLSPGGRQLYRIPYIPENTVSIEPAISNKEPGCKVATPGRLPGELKATTFSCGTSNAAALVSRAAGICYDSLLSILSEHINDIDFNLYVTSLLKAMLVHGCSWSDIIHHFKKIKSQEFVSGKIKDLISYWAGYGNQQIDRVLTCTGQRATLLGFGQLKDGEANVFKLPLPLSLSSKHQQKRLTATLAWLSPIAAMTQRYRVAGLWFDIKHDLRLNRSNADHNAVKRGTVQHEIFEGDSADLISDGQCIEIKVNCRSDANKILKTIPYGLVVSFEISEDIDLDIYSEIRSIIMSTLPIN